MLFVFTYVIYIYIYGFLPLPTNMGWVETTNQIGYASLALCVMNDDGHPWDVYTIW